MSWDSYAEGWDEDEGARAYAAAASESLTRLCSRRGIRLEGARVLDFGCGTGLLTEKLAPVCASVVALDTSPRMIECLEAKIERRGLANVSTTTDGLDQAIADSASPLRGPFDLIVCSSVCSFLDDYPATALQLAQLLGAGGLFVQWDWEREPAAEDTDGLTRAEVRDALAAAGLVEIEVATAFEVPAQGTTMRPLMGAGQGPSAPRRGS